MRKHLALLVLAALAVFTHAGAWAVTYTYTGPTYTSNSITTFTAPCAAPTCANFTTAMRQTGSFTTAVPLPANLNNADIKPLITSYAFDDGLHQYSSTASGDNMLFAFVFTDAAGNITSNSIAVLQWQTASHGTNDRMNAIDVDNGSRSNTACQILDSPGVCQMTNGDASTSLVFAHAGASGWSTNAAPSGPPTITSPVPPGGTVGVPYSYTLTAVGTQPMNFIDAGTLPPGLAIGPTTGTITGTPTTAGSFTVTLSASNGVLPQAVQAFTLNIAPAGAGGGGGGSVAAVPTLSEWSLLLLACLTGGIGWSMARRRR